MERSPGKVTGARRRLSTAVSVLALAAAAGARGRASPVHRVLLLDSYGRDFTPYGSLIGSPPRPSRARRDAAARFVHPVQGYFDRY